MPGMEPLSDPDVDEREAQATFWRQDGHLKDVLSNQISTGRYTGNKLLWLAIGADDGSKGIPGGLQMQMTALIDPEGPRGGVWPSGRSPLSVYLICRTRDYKKPGITDVRVRQLNVAVETLYPGPGPLAPPSGYDVGVILKYK
eukprot:gene16418-biopygen4168